MKYALTFVSFLVCSQIYAQYWFGPLVGVQRTDFHYQDAEYKKDTFNIKSNYSFHAGGMAIYQASDKYAVQVELMYEHVRRLLTNKSNSDVPVYSSMAMSFISMPLSLRWNFGHGPIHYYVSGGPKLSYWLGGSGKMYLDEFDEYYGGKTLHYKIVFRESKSGGSDPQRMAVVEANRVQYGLQLATGMYFDLINGGRIMLDLKYVFGHSNMAFNNNPDFKFDAYSENFKFRNNMVTASVAYLFEYDAKGRIRGMSTIRESNKKHKH